MEISLFNSVATSSHKENSLTWLVQENAFVFNLQQ